MSKTAYKEHSSELMDSNDSEANITSQGITINQRLEEDIVKGVTTEIEHEVWLRVRKLNWAHQEAADYFNYSIETIRSMLKNIDKKVRKFKTSVKMRGGNFFY
ncbi:hypothetical protein [uncultured Ilyobacter sp.]|uniref:hypothetical protein n=1 Tax=uncultured Ilyobacter sp. TaxID=544433 RepID=UPI0029C93821|nr:hypothetical protein [uncultured Ilyobacter sp.]